MSIEQELRYYAPAIMLDRIFPRRFRRRLIRILFIASLALIIVRVAVSLLFGGSLMAADSLTGTLFIFVSAWFTLFALHSFGNTRYFRGSSALVLDPAYSGARTGMTYETATILLKWHDDVTRGFLRLFFGTDVMNRLAIGRSAIEEFLKTERTRITLDDIVLPQTGVLSCADLALFILKNDKSFADFLFSIGVREGAYRGAALFVSRLIEREKWNERFWSRARLEAIKPIGSDWSYGGAWVLERFAREPRSASVFSSLVTLSGEGDFLSDTVTELATVLSRAKEANAILVGEDGVGKRDVIVALQNNIRNEMVPPELLGKHVLVLDDESFIATYNTKALFEQNLITMLQQAERAGNVILALIDLPGFLKSAEVLGADVGSLLDPYLASSDLHVVATANPMSFHRYIETHPDLLQRLEKMFIESPGSEGVIAVLDSVILQYERTHKVFFTYQAIQAIAEHADRYIVGGVMPDKAVDLLVEVLPSAKQKGIEVITKEFVDKYVKEKTGIPIGAISGEERDTLLNLEDILHRRVIGQDEAIDTIANAMRRARAGIQNPARPIGSFLFLGPTGVGKTETTKALAAVFFGDEKKLLRLDMSEYNSPDALTRLIGSGADDAGDLSVILKEHSYGVLLLDEFEKTVSEVKDLFLQILDEGVFTNARGERISARNIIIIATSNAGSSLIWKYGKEERPLAEKKDEIIETIIKEGIYKPELINRFDGVVLFHALQKKHLKDIAHIMLERLKSRIRLDGYKLVINDTLVDLLVEDGYDPQFGARPMQRVVQDRIEKEIAQKILEGSIKPGSSIEFTAADF